MTPERLKAICSRYKRLKVAVVGDYCLDRYLHIDPALKETSLETHLPVHNVVAVRPQPGGAGSVLCNVAALRPAKFSVLSICGDDGHGFELRQALSAMGADLSHLIVSDRRMTFTYTKPLVMQPGRPPRELSRLDVRSRSPLGKALEDEVIAHLQAVVKNHDVIIALEQVPEPGTGVLTRRVKRALGLLAAKHPKKIILADSRCAIGEFQGVTIKINRGELLAHFKASKTSSRTVRSPSPSRERGLGGQDLAALAGRWAGELGQGVFVTLAEEGIIAATAQGVWRVPAVPVKPPIDVVGAGDSVSANIALALGAGASPVEAAEIGSLAGSIVIKKLGTTGTASVAELAVAAARVAQSKE